MFDASFVINPVGQPLAPVNDSPDFKELNRLLTAAIVSPRFRHCLFSDPERALAAGFQGENFNLSLRDRQWILSIQPTTLTDFASALLAYQNAQTRMSDVYIPLRTFAPSIYLK